MSFECWDALSPLLSTEIHRAFYAWTVYTLSWVMAGRARIRGQARPAPDVGAADGRDACAAWHVWPGHDGFLSVPCAAMCYPGMRYWRFLILRGFSKCFQCGCCVLGSGCCVSQRGGVEAPRVHGAETDWLACVACPQLPQVVHDSQRCFGSRCIARYLVFRETLAALALNGMVTAPVLKIQEMKINKKNGMFFGNRNGRDWSLFGA
jgi:hypothetical protein